MYFHPWISQWFKMRCIRRTWPSSAGTTPDSFPLSKGSSNRTYNFCRVPMCENPRVLRVLLIFNNQKIAICKIESCFCFPVISAAPLRTITLSQRINYESCVCVFFSLHRMYRLQPRILSKERIDQRSVIHERSREAPSPWIRFLFLSIFSFSRLVCIARKCKGLCKLSRPR